VLGEESEPEGVVVVEVEDEFEPIESDALGNVVVAVYEFIPVDLTDLNKKYPPAKIKTAPRIKSILVVFVFCMIYGLILEYRRLNYFRLSAEIL
jgi:hypothetical protein